MADSLGFRCTFQSLGSVVCLVLSGELELATVATLVGHLAMVGRDTEGLLLDLRDLRYLDSTGINALLDTYRASGRLGRRIALVGASPNVRRILSVLNLETLMPMFPNRNEALVYLRSESESEPPRATA